MDQVETVLNELRLMRVDAAAGEIGECLANDYLAMCRSPLHEALCSVALQEEPEVFRIDEHADPAAARLRWAARER